MVKTINNYKLYQKKPNTICKGAKVYFKMFLMDTDNEFKNRLVRVYLPSTYDFKNSDNRYPVIYMMDGKNLFDDYTSFVGEWGIDETIEQFIYDKVSKGIIVVGVDAPKTDVDRTLEMTPNDIRLKDKYQGKYGYANKLGDFIFGDLKKDIDNTFFTLTDRDNTFVGGSSMGGLMAYYLTTHYSEQIGASLMFSPAFFLLEINQLNAFLDSTKNLNLPRMFYYVGNIGFEHVFIKDTKKVFNFYKKILNKEDIVYIFNDTAEHNEKAWRVEFVKAYRFLNK